MRRSFLPPSVKLRKFAYNVCPLADARGSVLSAACTEPRPSGSGLGLQQLGTRVLPLALCLLASGVIPRAAYADTLAELGAQFWEWRARQQPFSEDDIPRLDRPADLSIDWSASHVSAWRKELAEFEQRWKAIDVAGGSVENQVDYRLIGSA